MRKAVIESHRILGDLGATGISAALFVVDACAGSFGKDLMSFCEVTGDESVGTALDELEVGCYVCV